MRIPAVAILVWLAAIIQPKATMADSFDAALLRAARAKDIALDEPSPSHWREAYALYSVADELRTSAETQYELGVIASQLELVGLAVEHFTRAAALGVAEPARGNAQSYIHSHSPSLAKLHVEGRPGWRIRIDGYWRGVLPLLHPVLLSAGHTTIDVFGSSNEHLGSVAVQLAAGEKKSIVPSLKAAEADSVTRQSTGRPQRGPLTLGRSASIGSRDESGNGHIAKMLLAPGAGVLASSTFLLIVSQFELSGKRDQLRLACDDWDSSSPDGCPHARPGSYQTAIDLASDIARWRTVRAASLVGLGAGALTTATAIMLRINGKSHTADFKGPSWATSLDVTPFQFGLSLARRF